MVSGFGQGLGEEVILGALESLYKVQKGRETGRTFIRPFPRVNQAVMSQLEQNKKHRADLISQSGIVIYLCGNRESEGKIMDSVGVKEEFEIAKRYGRFPIPVGATGYAAKIIWDEVNRTINDYFPFKGVKKHFKHLCNQSKSNAELVSSIFSIVDAILREKEI